MAQAPVEPKGSEKGVAVAEPPSGWRRLLWLGPGILWMVAATGSGELLFTPRVGALYGYALLWALLLAVLLKWAINREVGRFAVCSGAPVLEGFAALPGPKSWAVWLIVVPQTFVAVATIAGLAGSAATAVVLVLPGPIALWMAVLTLGSAAIVWWGKYQGVEFAAKALAAILGAVSIVAAASVFPGIGPLAAGLVPQMPSDAQQLDVLAWLGFMLSGAAGLIWYSYWLPAKGYGRQADKSLVPGASTGDKLTLADQKRLRSWLRQMTLDNSVAVAGALVIALAFLILGTELLRPEGAAPEEGQVAATLGRLLGDIWGPTGFWFMVGGIFVGFWRTTLSVQDGFARMFAHGAQLLYRGPRRRGDPATPERGEFWRRVWLVGLLTLPPIGLFLIAGQPVALLKIAGGIEAAHIPVVAGLTLWANSRLPRELRPSWPAFGLASLGGLFFLAFAIGYVLFLVAPAT